MVRKPFVWAVMMGILLAGIVPYVLLGKPGSGPISAMTFNIFNPVWDEQDTNAFYNGTEFCLGTDSASLPPPAVF